MATKFYRQLDLSGGVQSSTSYLLRKSNEVVGSKNAVFNYKIGSFARRLGYEQVADTIQHNKDGLGLHVYKYDANNKVLVGTNNSGDTNATLRYMDTGGYWTNIITDAAPNTRFDIATIQNEAYVAGASDNNTYLTLQNIDGTLTRSLTRNVLNAPKAKFITDFQNGLVAINVEINGVKYPDRFYYSSPALGAVTFIQTDQVGLLTQLRVDSVRYLKPGMVIDIYGAGTEAKKVDSLSIISVDKKQNRISFTPTSINVSDNDEIWLEDRKGKLSILWNTDYPTPQDADWRRVPPGRDSNPDFTGHGKNNNRLILFTRNSMMKYDGANLVTISDTIGCVSHQSIRNVGPWIVWLHDTGVYRYNDNSGEPQLISKPIENYIRAILDNSKASAGVVGKMYKLAVGELGTLDSVTTSTSTSSTSTSSTSSSTSSTSTSSTSTSSTSSSTSSTSSSTSTSSTSTSTSTTSTSSTSASTSSTSSSSSTSTSSTTTTTVASTRAVSRLVYDFDMNAWWIEEHKRNIRFQVNHSMHGLVKPYFLDDTGRFFRDETGDLDHQDTIPMEVEIGRNPFQTDLPKDYTGAIVTSTQARTAQLLYSINGGEFKNLGQLDNRVKVMKFQPGQQGNDINYKFTHNDPGERPIIDGPTTQYNEREMTIG